ncbi:alpha-ribazole phosphatase [Aquimarina amphilecti]|uniref:Alpha-ribazole phosphatase n=1 Tax=Aquimarina amphilecti TaxID=1038014 RepID=A0A1H7WQG3_AQUAM|nr:alpha-ribazole phosphatase [Aquimarina amphilecti]SEM23732.1 alpha-ribazole phosphatase [Aquimarina amphilecti]
MEIYLVRHTTPDIKKGICYGQSDLGVTSTFESEVIEIHHRIPSKEISKIYCSPLKRCKILAESFNIQIKIDNRLQELNFGNWELKTWDDIPQEELNPWMEDFVNVKVPNGESYVMLQERIVEFYESLDHSSDEKIIIVAHAGPIRALLAYIRQIDLKDSFKIKVSYGDVIKI